MPKRLLVATALLVLLIQAVIQVRLASTDSQTTDEAVHLSAGYTYLTRGDWRFNPEHPPLVKIIAALPLLAIKPHITSQMEADWAKSGNLFYDSWKENRSFGEAMMYQAGNNPDVLLFSGRMPMVLLTLLLGLAIFWIALKHWGAETALAATLLYALNPIINGHGHLITTDIAISLGFLLSVYTFWQFLERPTWIQTLFWAVSFGFALLTKHTAIILLPTFVAMLIVALVRQKREFKWRSFLAKSIVGLLMVWVLLWAGFGFHDRTAPTTESISSEILAAYVGTGQTTNLHNIPKLDRMYRSTQPLLRLLPADYVKGLLLVTNHASGGHSSYLLGQESRTGWWYYFPVLLLLKTPLAILIIFGAGLYLIIARRPREIILVSSVAAGAVFMIVAMDSKADLGVRHILPIFPLLTIAGGWAIGLAERWRWISGALLLWLVVINFISYPSYLGYFNELAGWPNNNYQIATDSNLDWGQDLKRIEQYVNEHNLKNVYVGYSWDGLSALDYYLGSNSYQLLENWTPKRGGVAILGVSAYAAGGYPNLTSCPNRQFITNGTVVCNFE